MNFIINFFATLGLALHKLFHPHCEHCRLMDEEAYEKIEDSKVCQSCEHLRLLLEQEKAEKKRLLDEILKHPEQVESKPSPDDMKPLGKRYMPWNVVRQNLENKYRLQSRESVKDETIESLEEELGIKEDAGENR